MGPALYRFFQDDHAQATTEYILVLSIIVGMVAILAKKLVQPILLVYVGRLGSQISNSLFNGDFHVLRIRP